jgi:fructose-bisphosphate aldolase class I
MNATELIETAHFLVASGKGLLAMDESNKTCDKRLAAVGVAPSEATRRAWRELIVTTPGLGQAISGAILYDETIRQCCQDGETFIHALLGSGIIPGIKVDTGTTDLAAFPGERVTEGLDGLRDRLAHYYTLGARFAKWRAVITPGAATPTRGCLQANAQALARYAALCQEAGLVPIVEPEVVMDGGNTLAQCQQITEETLRCVFGALHCQRVRLEAMVLKPNMVLPGLRCAAEPTLTEVASATIRSLRRVVPAAVPGIAFLSGGQSPELATARLNAMNISAKSARPSLPWPLVFSFARAIQNPALAIWQGKDDNASAAQEALRHRALCNHAALRGDYSAMMER